MIAHVQQVVTTVFLIGVVLALGAAAVVTALALVKRRRVELKFAWYDMWVGAYIDAETGTWYICPFPGILIKTTPKE